MIWLIEADPNVIESEVIQATEDIVSRHPATERRTASAETAYIGC
jgi:hypothetical protein